VLALLGAALPASAVADVVANPDPDLIARWEPCEPAPAPGAGVTVVVDRQALGDQKLYVGCAEGGQPSGWAALQAAGFAVEGLGGGVGFACRIDGQPTPAEEACVATPGVGSYWSYWRGKPGGRWGYSGVGPGNPLSAAGLDDVQGWSFGGGNAPRIEPQNGDGPSGFVLPPVQESSVVPAARASEWLPGALNASAELAASGELVDPNLERLLNGAAALFDAGIDPAALAPLAEWLREGCGEGESATGGCPLVRAWAGPDLLPNQLFPERFHPVLLGVHAVGDDPHDFAGMDLRGSLLGMIEAGTGRVWRQNNYTDGPEALAFTVEALARTGPLPPEALETIDLLLSKQNEDTGAFGNGATLIQTKAIKALAAARDAGIADLDDALQRAGERLKGWQEEDGSIRLNAGTGPNFERTAVGAVGLALAGFDEEAEAAAKWVSRYQVSAEYIGAPDPVTWEPPPGAAVLGAFLPTESALRNAVNVGIPSPYVEALEPTAQALLALVTAGPYGPFHAVPDQESLWFGSLELGMESDPLVLTLVNHDVRSLEVEGAGLAGDAAAEFSLDDAGCAGQTLAPGEGCPVAVRFAPAVEGAREGVLSLELAGGQEIGLGLGGSGFAVRDPDPGPDPGEQPDAEQPQPRSPSGSISPALGDAPAPAGDPVTRRKAPSAVGPGRRAGIATLSCPRGGAPCAVRAPKRVWVRIGGKRFSLAVLAPRQLSAGGRGALRVRLSKAALKRLRGRRAVVGVEVEVGGLGERTVKATIRAPARSGKARRGGT
jgi:hypothetical protein